MVGHAICVEKLFLGLTDARCVHVHLYVMKGGVGVSVINKLNIFVGSLA